MVSYCSWKSVQGGYSRDCAEGEVYQRMIAPKFCDECDKTILLISESYTGKWDENESDFKITISEEIGRAYSKGASIVIHGTDPE